MFVVSLKFGNSATFRSDVEVRVGLNLSGQFGHLGFRFHIGNSQHSKVAQASK